MDDFVWLKRSENIYTSRRDNVYAYLFIEQKSIYIGRTVNLQERDTSHRTSNKSAVFKFATKCNVTVPEMTILESNITIIEGLEKEDYYCNKFKEDGWNLLNVAKTGIKSGSVGALGSGKWTYNKCYEQAKKYTTLKDFRNKDATAYNKARNNDWLKDYTWLISTIHKPWTYDECYEEAKKYERRIDFQRESGSAYTKALTNGWIDDYLWFKESVTKLKWTYDKCYEEAKKYTTLKDFINSDNSTAYHKALNNDWLKDYTWLDKKDISQKKVAQYTLSGEFITQYNGVREACRINGLKSNSGISQCCNGKLQSHKGYKWQYI